MQIRPVSQHAVRYLYMYQSKSLTKLLMRCKFYRSAITDKEAKKKCILILVSKNYTNPEEKNMSDTLNRLYKELINNILA